MSKRNLSVDQIVDILSNTDAYVLEEVFEQLVEVDPDTSYVIHTILTNLEAGVLE
jgi:hypothetical protein